MGRHGLTAFWKPKEAGVLVSGKRKWRLAVEGAGLSDPSLSHVRQNREEEGSSATPFVHSSSPQSTRALFPTIAQTPVGPASGSLHLPFVSLECSLEGCFLRERLHLGALAMQLAQGETDFCLCLGGKQDTAGH